MHIKSREQLGELARDQRKQLGISQAELAQLVTGVSRQWVVELEAGRANPDLETLSRLVDALQLRLEIVRGSTATLSVGSPDLDEILRKHKKRG